MKKKDKLFKYLIALNVFILFATILYCNLAKTVFSNFAVDERAKIIANEYASSSSKTLLGVSYKYSPQKPDTLTLQIDSEDILNLDIPILREQSLWLIWFLILLFGLILFNLVATIYYSLESDGFLESTVLFLCAATFFVVVVCGDLVFNLMPKAPVIDYINNEPTLIGPILDNKLLVSSYANGQINQVYQLDTAEIMSAMETNQLTQIKAINIGGKLYDVSSDTLDATSHIVNILKK